MKVAGVICPLVTPLDPDGRLNAAAVPPLLERLAPELDGVFVRGSSGEFPSLRSDDADELARVAHDCLAGSLPLYVGVGDTSTSRTIARLESLPAGAAEFVVSGPPFYFSVNSAPALIAHFTAIADSAPAPVLLYNIPGNTGTVIPLDTVAAMAGHPNVVGMKDSSGDMFYFRELIALQSDDFVVLQGREQLASMSLVLGARGVVPAAANLNPAIFRRLLAAAEQRDLDRLAKLQSGADDMCQVMGHGYWLAALKFAVSSLGVAVGPAAAPIPALSDQERESIVNVLRTGGLL